MPENRRIIRVFLASPGDLVEERKAAKALTDEFNDEVAHELGYQVELIGWEDTVASAQRPQALINRDVERCELLIGMLWRKWGTPPDTSGPYTSGFEEEFQTSLDRRKKTGTPEISLYFKDVGTDFLKDPGKDLKKVIAFKEEIASKKELYYESFGELTDFARKFRRRISKYLFEVRNQEIAGNVQREQTQTPTLSTSAPAGVDETESPLSNEGSEFLRGLLEKTDRSETPNATEVARFRLLSTIVNDQGNDEQYLATHDANIIFNSDAQLVLSWAEIVGLLRAGLYRYSTENVPFWRWFAHSAKVVPGILALYSQSDTNSHLRSNALRAMRLVGDSLGFEPEFDRAFFDDVTISAQI